MTSASGSTNSLILPEWNIQATLNTHRITPRREWEENFQKSYLEVAQKISESIAREIFKELEAMLKDPFVELPNPKKPRIFYFSLEIGKSYQAQKVLEWAQDSATLAPFDTWFAKLIPNKRDIREEQGSISLQPSMVFTKQTIEETNIDIEYFQGEMAKVGRLVASNLDTVLNNFKSIPSGNNDFNYRVTWYRKAEQYLANPSSSRDNYVSVELFFANQAVPRVATSMSEGGLSRSGTETNGALQPAQSWTWSVISWIGGKFY